MGAFCDWRMACSRLHLGDKQVVALCQPCPHIPGFKVADHILDLKYFRVKPQEHEAVFLCLCAFPRPHRKKQGYYESPQGTASRASDVWARLPRSSSTALPRRSGGSPALNLYIKTEGLGFRVQVSRFRVEGSWLRVLG